MGNNSFGKLFTITTWGESHGKAVGVVIDGCPAGLPLSEEEIQKEVDKRRSGQNPFTSPRQEEDRIEILSGLFDGKTTGTPLSILIHNRDCNPNAYAPLENLYRPGHANYTYLEKYGIFDFRGGGRASARETVCRVAAGAVAKKLLRHYEIDLVAYLKEAGGIGFSSHQTDNLETLREKTLASPLFCPDEQTTNLLIEKLNQVKLAGDSIGGIVELIATGLPVGLGDPVFEKLEAKIGHALLSLPATKGVEIGSGFAAASMSGSEHNDQFTKTQEGKINLKTNHAGGTLGGISTGMPLVVRVAFKPTSSIKKEQETVDREGNPTRYSLPEGSRHDPCVALRAPPIVEAMTALVLADTLLLHRSSRL
ncbi:MAG: Chorismate synthase [Chlamydiae bacterium]|nr:Chorismate synthase [Chlamydiota bacterium]